MGYASELSAAVTEAQNVLGQLTGAMPSDAAGNFVGPDGEIYTLTLRAADAFETQAAGLEMTQHGHGVQSIMIATADRAQFSAPPLSWRRQKGAILYPTRRDALVSTVAIDDPYHYVFTLVVRQEA